MHCIDIRMGLLETWLNEALIEAQRLWYLYYLQYRKLIFEFCAYCLKLLSVSISGDELIAKTTMLIEYSGINTYINCVMLYLELNDKNLVYTKVCSGCLILSTLSAIIIYYITVPRLSAKEKKIKALQACRKALAKDIKNLNCNPILLRLAFSDVQTYDKNISKWALAGGANGNIRLDQILSQPVNAGLLKGIEILKPLKSKYPRVSWSDLIQMGGALAVELAGGPIIDIRYGRVDVSEADILAASKGTGSNKKSPFMRVLSEYMSKSPCPLPPYPSGASSAEIHIRNVFYRMGFNNRDIVALMGAHTLGRAFKDRSGVSEYSSGEQGATPFTRQSSIAKSTGEPGIGIPGGCSWTKNWLSFDNSYYERIIGLLSDENSDNQDNEYLLWLPTDQALYDSPEFQSYFIKYAKDQAAFFNDYAVAHKKMSELGCKFSPEAITLPPEPASRK